MDEEEDYIEPCSICLLDLIPENKDEAENLGILSCNHKFHEQCIKLWSKKSHTCPLDRGEFTEIKIYNYNEEYLSTYVINKDKKEKNQEIEIEELSFCIICGSSEHEEIMLLCDMCDAPYHTTCVGLDSVPAGNWYCPNCINENPALVSSTVQNNEPENVELVYETTSVSEASTSKTRKKTKSKSNGSTKRTKGKKSRSRTVANSTNKRIKASRSLISKLRKEILQRRQYSISINNRLLKETALIDIPNNIYDNYFDAYRASTSDKVSTRNLSSLREKLNYETKRKYANMLDTQSVNNIIEKPSSYNRNSEYDLIWRQANLAKKIKSNSSNLDSDHSLKINENKSSSSLKRPNIALRRMREQKANFNTNNINNNNNNNNNNNSVFLNNSINCKNKNLASGSNNSFNNSTKISNTSYTNHNMNHNIPNNKNSINNNVVHNSYSSSSGNNHKNHYISSNNSINETHYLSPYPNVNKSSSSNIQKYNLIPNDNYKYSSNNNLNDEIQKRENKDITKDKNSSSKDHNEYSSSEIFKFIKPYIMQRVKNRHITREQYKKLTKDTTYYVLKRLGNSYKGEHKLNYDELKEDFLVDHSFSNKIIINFINYNIIKFLEINKNLKPSTSNNTNDHPKPK